MRRWGGVGCRGGCGWYGVTGGMINPRTPFGYRVVFLLPFSRGWTPQDRHPLFTKYTYRQNYCFNYISIQYNTLSY